MPSSPTISPAFTFTDTPLDHAARAVFFHEFIRGKQQSVFGRGIIISKKLNGDALCRWRNWAIV